MEKDTRNCQSEVNPAYQNLHFKTSEGETIAQTELPALTCKSQTVSSAQLSDPESVVKISIKTKTQEQERLDQLKKMLQFNDNCDSLNIKTASGSASVREFESSAHESTHSNDFSSKQCSCKCAQNQKNQHKLPQPKFLVPWTPEEVRNHNSTNVILG
jgi:hypothetical protein